MNQGESDASNRQTVFLEVHHTQCDATLMRTVIDCSAGLTKISKMLYKVEAHPGDQAVTWVPMWAEMTKEAPLEEGLALFRRLEDLGIWKDGGYSAEGMLDGEGFEASLRDEAGTTRHVSWFCPEEKRDNRLDMLISELRKLV